MKDSWPAPMATSEMPRGESRLDSPFLEAAERYLELLARSPLLAASVKRPGPVKSVQVIVPRRRRLISCPETKIAAKSRVRKEEKRGRRERAKEGKFGGRNQDVSPCAARGLLSQRTIHVYWSQEREQSSCMCAQMPLWRPKLHPCQSVLPPCFSWSYVRGFENGRRSYELALEDNYDGDPRTTIYYAVT